MSGVWEFKSGAMRLEEEKPLGSNENKKVLVHTSSNEDITSYEVLEEMLKSLGWERYYDDPNLLQFRKVSTVHLISLPKDFNNLSAIHMYDIVLQNKNEFQVRDK